MTDEEYLALVARVKAGSLLIGVDRSLSRMLYTDVSLSRFEAETGEKPYVEKAVVIGASVVSPVSLIASLVMAVLTLGWWAIIAIPISIVAYMLNMMSSSQPKRGIGGLSILLVFALFSLPFNWIPARLEWYVVLALFSLWSARLVYVAATFFVRAFVVRNRRGYEFLVRHGTCQLLRESP